MSLIPSTFLMSSHSIQKNGLNTFICIGVEVGSRERFTHLRVPGFVSMTPDGSLFAPLYLHVIVGLGTPRASHMSSTTAPALGLRFGPSGL